MKLTLLGPHDIAKLLSFLFAVVLWFHVATEQGYRYGVTMPIRYADLPSGDMLANTPPDKLQISISGTGKDLLLFRLQQLSNPYDSYAAVSLAAMSPGTHVVTIEKDDLHIPESDGVSVQDILSNESFPVIIDRKIECAIAVDTDSLPPYRLEEGFVLSGRPIAIPDSVLATGPKEFLTSMRSMRIESLKPSSISVEDTIVTAQLNNPSPFVSLNRSTVDVRLNIERLRTKLFRIPVRLSGFPRRATSVSPDTVSVVIQGPESIISVARSEDIRVEVTYQSYLEQSAKGDSLIAPFVNYPEGITNISTAPDAVRIP